MLFALDFPLCFLHFGKNTNTKLAGQICKLALSIFVGKMCFFEFSVPINPPDLGYASVSAHTRLVKNETRRALDHSVSGAEK